MSDSDFSELIDKFIDIKQKLTEMEKKHEKYRKIISDYMAKDDIKNMRHKSENGDIYVLKKTLMARQSVSKEDLPKEIWEKYAKTSTFHTIRVDKEKKEKKESRKKKEDFSH
jgi:hypothetical protein